MLLYQWITVGFISRLGIGISGFQCRFTFSHALGDQFRITKEFWRERSTRERIRPFPCTPFLGLCIRVCHHSVSLYRRGRGRVKRERDNAFG